MTYNEDIANLKNASGAGIWWVGTKSQQGGGPAPAGIKPNIPPLKLTK
jgi:hypothetical protein